MVGFSLILSYEHFLVLQLPLLVGWSKAHLCLSIPLRGNGPHYLCSGLHINLIVISLQWKKTNIISEDDFEQFIVINGHICLPRRGKMSSIHHVRVDRQSSTAIKGLDLV